MTPLLRHMLKSSHKASTSRWRHRAVSSNCPTFSHFLELDKYLRAILLGGLILTIVGWVDDIKDLSPYIRLVANLAVALLVVGAGIGIAYISNPFGGGVIHLDQPQLTFWLGSGFHSIWILADLFAVLFIIWNMNSINWASGLDGQMTGFTAITAAFIGILSTGSPMTQLSSTHFICVLSLLVRILAIFSGIGIHKSMPGYGGSTLAGFFSQFWLFCLEPKSLLFLWQSQCPLPTQFSPLPEESWQASHPLGRSWPSPS